MFAKISSPWTLLTVLIALFAQRAKSDENSPFISWPEERGYGDSSNVNSFVAPCGSAVQPNDVRYLPSTKPFVLGLGVKTGNYLNVSAFWGQSMGDNDTSLFTQRALPTISLTLQEGPSGFLCIPNIASPAFVSSEQNGIPATLQVIFSSDRGITYSCSDVVFVNNATADSTGNENCQNYSVSVTSASFSDSTYVNGTPPIISSTSSQFSASATTPAATASSSNQPNDTSSGKTNLSTGAKAGIGVGVALGVIVIAAILVFLFLRRRRKTPPQSSPPRATEEVSDKPELQGSRHDPAIAGPVKQKAELSMGDHRQTPATRTELPSPTSANAPWTHSGDGYLPPELGYSSVTGEASESISQSSPTSRFAGSSTTKVSSARDSGGGNLQGTFTGVSANEAIRQTSPADDTLANEADFLVQELGLINMRKKALSNAAAAQGMKPEEVPGTRGEDYCELVEREQKLRRRMEEMDQMRST